MNTMITYLYRDASNYKVWNSEVIEGEMTDDMIKSVMSSCKNPMPDISQFIPEMVGLPLERFGTEDDDDDTNAAELFYDEFKKTEDAPTVIEWVSGKPLTAEKLTSNFAEASKTGWDETVERTWLL